MTALHNAELAGQECAKSGGEKASNPYAGKKMRGAVAGLYRAWECGFDEQKRAADEAAPDLRESLRRLVAAIEGAPPGELTAALAVANAALAKSEGATT